LAAINVFALPAGSFIGLLSVGLKQNVGLGSFD
jgi:hypothetical protein